MRTQACEPCAKRKVRCDREEPCSNCKRRKQDHCSYTEVSTTAERTRKPENTRTFGSGAADADDLNGRTSSAVFLALPATTSPHETQEAATSADQSSKDPVIVEQDGHQYYLESWDLDRLESATASRSHDQLDDADRALVASIYLAAVISLTDAECREKFGHPRATLISECHATCEKAMAATNLLGMKNIVALKALAIYLFMSLDCLSTQSLWTLMGLAIRNGEKLGIHRDGTLLRLSPPETEERRRLWWQLQYLDLILAVRLGVTPSTLMIDWDAKLPLNVEDEDFIPGSQTFPKERTGLTSMSYCLFTSYVLYEQRQYHADKGRFELSWSTNQSISLRTKEDFINHLEDGLNRNFIQYCDLIKPLHILLQIMSRALICIFRQRILLTGGHVDPKDRGELLALSVQCIEYSIAFHSQQIIKDFRWLTTNGFPWPACE
ncbi:hypothetical protein KJ359_008511 [Pestalotiopsis sp. 9143b]|nr:hypothetical protein KJ359_008511 [Pestalotiopsis sp. 9143b]